MLVDDPHNEQDIINGNFDVFDKAYEWFTYGARTRLMPGGRVAIIQTRWHLNDLTGRVVADMGKNEDSDQYEVVEFPALFESDDGTKRALWPEFYDVQALLPILGNAGGVMTNWRGGDCGNGGQVIAAGDPRIHEQALKILAEIGRAHV